MSAVQCIILYFLHNVILLLILQEVARVGLTAEAEVTYQIEPRGTGKVCATCSSWDYQTCAGLYDSWPGNSISLYAWYQLREVEWCEGWFGVSRFYCLNNGLV